MGRIRPRPNIQRPDRPQEQASEAQVRAMEEKLKARVKQVSAVSVSDSRPDAAPVPISGQPQQNSLALPAAQSPKEKARVELDWERPAEGAMAVKTTCKRYSVSKVSVMGKISYELWRRANGGEWYSQLANQVESFAKAKQLADEDVNKC